MKQIIYNYLNYSLGPKVFLLSNEDQSWSNIYSTNKTRIISFRVTNDWEHIKIFRDDQLCKTVGSLFCIGFDEAAIIIKDWFGEIHNLKKVSDLRKLVPETV